MERVVVDEWPTLGVTRKIRPICHADKVFSFFVMYSHLEHLLWSIFIEFLRIKTFLPIIIYIQLNVFVCIPGFSLNINVF